MRAIERLKRDHQILRAKLDVLESALGMGSQTWFVLREMCHTLSRQLEDHIRREERLLDAYRHALGQELQARVALEHHDEPAHLRAVNRLFLDERGQSLEQIRPVLRAMIQGLRRHMEEEERDMFPMLEQTLGEHEMPADEEPPASPLHENMTVNRVFCEYPETGRVFRQLFVNMPYEGCDCLDEVAWRHGLSSDELVARLSEAIHESASSPGHGAPPECACR